MFKQVIRFEDAQSAHEFDQHLATFLRSLDDGEGEEDACVFTASQLDGGAQIRIIQTDCATVLGRLLKYLSAHDFPPSTVPTSRPMEVTH